VHALGRIATTTAAVGRHERRSEQRETADGDRGTESGHDGRRESAPNSGTSTS